MTDSTARITIAAAADRYGCSVTTIRRAIRTGLLRSHQRSKHATHQIDIADGDKWAWGT